MDKKVAIISGLALWILDLLVKHNETIYVEVDDNEQLVTKLYEEKNVRYISMYQNDSRPILIKGVKKVKAFKFNDLLELTKNDKDLCYEVDDCCIYVIRSSFTKN